MTARDRASRLIGMTVFARLSPRAPSDRILAMLFHRSAAVVYLTYAAWGLVAIIGVIPTIADSIGAMVQDVYSTAVMLAAFAAFIGATFFPRTGRTEMVAAVVLAGLIAYYILTLAGAAFDGTPGRWPAVVYGVAHMIVPVTRAAFVYLTLVRSSGWAR